MKNCKICGNPTENRVLCDNCLKRIENGELNLKSTEARTTQNNQEPYTYNQNISIKQKEKGCFTKGCTGTLGIGCGALLFIGLIIGIVLLILYSIFNASF